MHENGAFLNRDDEGKKMLPLFGSTVIIPGVRETQPNRGACLIRVKVRMNESLDQLLKRFKKACEKEGLTKDIKRVAYYEKPSEKRRRRQRKGGGPKVRPTGR